MKQSMLLLNNNECAFIYIIYFTFCKITIEFITIIFILNPIQMVFSACYGDFKRIFPCLLCNKLPVHSDGSFFTNCNSLFWSVKRSYSNIL